MDRKNLRKVYWKIRYCCIIKNTGTYTEYRRSRGLNRANREKEACY